MKLMRDLEKWFADKAETYNVLTGDNLALEFDNDGNMYVYADITSTFQGGTVLMGEFEGSLKGIEMLMQSVRMILKQALVASIGQFQHYNEEFYLEEHDTAREAFFKELDEIKAAQDELFEAACNIEKMMRGDD